MEIKTIFLKAIQKIRESKNKMVKKAEVAKKLNAIKNHITKTIKKHQMERQTKFGQNQKRPHDVAIQELTKIQEMLP